MNTATKGMSGLLFLLIIGVVIFSMLQLILPLLPGGVEGLVSSADTTIQHATERHGTEASLARQCSQRPDHIFRNNVTNRTAYVCSVEGFFGVHIVDKNGDEVTAFLKNKMKNFDQILQYMKNSGYELLH